MKTKQRKKANAALAIAAAALLSLSGQASAALVSLKGVPVPQPPNLGDFIKLDAGNPVDSDGDGVSDVVQLGKALFWDMQVGGDGVQACATCHFSAGADNRAKNQISPGLLGTPSDQSFQVGGPNFTLTLLDFFPNGIMENDVISSQGVHFRNFNDVIPGSAEDNCTTAADFFHVGSLNTRRVEPRNTPTMINAVFNHRNFWDGRAENTFNGVNPRGAGNEDAPLFRLDAGGAPQPAIVALIDSSAASQADGPPLSEFEMSCKGRTFAKLGRKMLSLTPLGKQFVDPTDSALGTLANPAGKGLLAADGYAGMIRAAFLDAWTSDQDVTVNAETFQQIEANFSLFFGLSVQLYETTLISNDTPFDRFVGEEGTAQVPLGDPTALTADQQAGLVVFGGQGRCDQCHDGPLFSIAAAGNPEFPADPALDPSVPANAFRHIGVRPIAEDMGIGGAPVSEAGLDGFFKIAGLRNVELTAPYFHNGGKATLAQVVDFYDGGGDFPVLGVTDGNIRPLGLGAVAQAQLVAFLKALTDDRVRLQQAPFDHPELCVPNGHPGDELAVDPMIDPLDPLSFVAKDDLRCIRAVGAAGSPVPVATFPVSPTLTAADDVAATGQDTPLVIAVLDNDSNSDPKGIDPTTVLIESEPARGAALPNADGTVTYTPGPGFAGEDSFTYSVLDQAGAVSNANVTNLATVNVTVTATVVSDDLTISRAFCKSRRGGICTVNGKVKKLAKGDPSPKGTKVAIHEGSCAVPLGEKLGDADVKRRGGWKFIFKGDITAFPARVCAISQGNDKETKEVTKPL